MFPDDTNYLPLFLPLDKFTLRNMFLTYLKKLSFCNEKKLNRVLNTAAIYSRFPAGNYMFKGNNRNTRTRCEICSKLTIKIASFWYLFC